MSSKTDIHKLKQAARLLRICLYNYGYYNGLSTEYLLADDYSEGLKLEQKAHHWFQRGEKLYAYIRNYE